jgi:hypothetical protein
MPLSMVAIVKSIGSGYGVWTFPDREMREILRKAIAFLNHSSLTFNTLHY